MTLPTRDPKRRARQLREWQARSKPLARTSTLERSGKLERRAELPPVNRERKARRRTEDLVYGSHHFWIRTLPCCLIGHPEHRCGYYPDRPGNEGHHLRTVGAGGRDRNNEVPACPVGHDELEAAGGVSSQCEWARMDLLSLACEYTARFDREHPTGAKT